MHLLLRLEPPGHFVNIYDCYFYLIEFLENYLIGSHQAKRKKGGKTPQL
jgi:hypothetical protein